MVKDKNSNAFLLTAQRPPFHCATAPLSLDDVLPLGAQEGCAQRLWRAVALSSASSPSRVVCPTVDLTLADT